VAKFVNAEAATGVPTALRVGVVKTGRVARAVSPFALGDTLAGSLAGGPPSDAGGVTGVFEIHNAAGGATHRMCTRFAVADGSTVTHRTIAGGTGWKLVGKRGVPATCPPVTSTTTTTTSTSTSVTTSTFPPCGAPDPICWGTCPEATPICASGPSGCECVPGATPCGSASFPECDGACPEDRPCVASSNLECTCDAVSAFPCELSGFPVCGGDCVAGEACISVSTPDGSGCVCQPIGSTCLEGSPVCNGTCPAGQTCFSIAGICLCG
jgi:hypothetical protein